MLFERAACWIEFAFEFLYLKAQGREEVELLRPSDWDTAFNEAQKHVALYEEARSEFGTQPVIFAQVSQARSIDDFQTAILRVHNEVQNRKNKGAYLDIDGNVLQEGAMNCERTLEVLGRLMEDGQISTDFVRFTYLRDWHYNRAARYKVSFE